MKDYHWPTIPIVVIGTGIVLVLAWKQRGKPASVQPSSGVGATMGSPVNSLADAAVQAAVEAALV